MIETLAENKEPMKKSELFFQMINKIFPNKDIPDAYKNFLDFKNKEKHPDNRARLEKMEKLERERQRNEWKKIVNDVPYKGSAAQNVRIMKAISEGNILPKETQTENTYSNIEKLNLSQDKINYITSTISPDQYSFYMQRLSNTVRDKFAALKFPQFVAIWDEEIKWVENTKKEMKNTFWNTITDKGVNNLWIANWLVDISSRMDVYEEKYINKDENTKKLFDSQVQQTTIWYKIYKPEEYAIIAKQCGWDQKLIDETIKKKTKWEVLTQWKESWKIKLDKEDEVEFAKLNIEFYEKMKEFGFEVSDAFKNIYDNALNYINTFYQSTDMYTNLSSKVLSDDEFNTYFDDKEGNKVEKLVVDEKKSVEYYKYLIKLYPDIDTKNIMTMFTEEYFTLRPTMHIKNSAPEGVKEAWERFLIVAEKKDKKLLERTNTIIQQSAIEQCLTALQKTIDIDMDEGKNILDDFVIDSNLDALEIQNNDLVLNLKGKTNDGKGEKIDVSYNLSTGEVYYKKHMQKAGIGDNAPIMIWSSKIQDDNLVPFITLPTLGNIVEKGKDMAENNGYLELMEKSEDSEMYRNNLQDIFKNEYTINENVDIDTELGQDMIKKNILEDSIVQKMLKIGGRDFPAGIITDTQYPSTYKLYNYLYNSFEYYSLKPMVQLKNWNDCMDKILAIKDANITPQEIINEEEKNNKNKERLVLNGLVNQKIMDKENPEMKNQVIETNLLSFFQYFETKKGGMSIVDVEMMKDYFALVTKNTNEGKLGNWARNEKFNSLYRDFHSKIWGELATKNLDEQLNYV